MATPSSPIQSCVRDAGPPSAQASPSNAGSTRRPKNLRRVGRPGKLVPWFGPDGQEGSLKAETDLRVGGRYRISFNANGEYFEVSGVYREIVPNERLVLSWAWHSTPERESLLTIWIKPEGAGTMLTLLHEQFSNEAARDNHEKGWMELLNKLEKYLA